MIFGHEDKLTAFKNLIENSRLSHAYLFYGSPEIGKFYFTRSLAYALEYGAFESKGSPLIDAVFVSPDEKGKISVETVREVRRFLSERPLRSSRRLVVIRDAQRLTKEAQSAMLKIVEEPGEAALIIFVAAEPQVLFAPLRSRLTKIYFRTLPKGEIKSILVEHRKITPAAAEVLALKSFGRLGRAFKLADGKKAESDLEEEIAEKIVGLYLKGVRANAALLKWLLEREVALKRFNLNTNLQRKALEYELR